MRRVARTARSTDRLHRGAGLRPVAGGGSGLEVHRRVQRALREAGCIARVAPGPVLAHLGEDVRERLGVHLYGVGLPVLDALLETVGREGDGPHPADVRNHLGAWRGSLPAAAENRFALDGRQRRRAGLQQKRDGVGVRERHAAAKARSVRHVGDRPSASGSRVEPGALLHEVLHQFVVASVCRAVQRRVALVIRGIDVEAKLEAVLHRREPRIGEVLREISRVSEPRRHHERRGSGGGGDSWIGAAGDQGTHRRLVSALRRAPERRRADRADPLLIVRRRPEPQLARQLRVRVRPVREQRLHQLEVADLLLDRQRVRRPGHRRVLHVDRRIERREPIHIREVRVGAVVDEELSDFVMAVADGDDQRAAMVAGAQSIHVGAGGDECAHGVQVAFPCGEQQRRHAPHHRVAAGHGTARLGFLLRQRIAVVVELVLLEGDDCCRRLEIGAVRRQRGDHASAVFRGGKHQRGLLVRGLPRVHIRSAFQEQGHGVRASGDGRCHQGGRTVRVRGVGAGPGVEHRLDHGRVAVLAGDQQRRDGADARGRFRARARRNEQRGDVEIVVERRPVQRRHAIALSGVDVDLLLQQGPDRLRVALLRRVGEPDISTSRGNHGRQAAGDEQRSGHHQIATSPVLSPKAFSSSPSLFPSVSRTFAIGVPCGHRT